MKLPSPLPLVVLAATAFASTGCSALDEILADSGSDSGPAVVYVREPSYPAYYDPYYRQPKYVRAPQYYESKSKKTKGNKVTTTKTIKNEYGQTVYKEKTTKPKKKK